MTCALYNELFVHTGLVHSAGYAVARGYSVTVAIPVRHLVQSDLRGFRNSWGLSSVLATLGRHSSGASGFYPRTRCLTYIEDKVVPQLLQISRSMDEQTELNKSRSNDGRATAGLRYV